MKFLLLLYAPERPRPEVGTPAGDRLYLAFQTAVQAMSDAGVLVECAPLVPVGDAVAVRVRAGRSQLGELVAQRERLAGYALITCAGRDEAVAWAGRFPAAQDARVEVWPVLQAP